MNIKLTEQQKVKLLNSTDVYEVMQRILIRENKIDRDKEHFWIIGRTLRGVQPLGWRWGRVTK